MEEKIGRITHYFGKLGVAAIEIEHGKIHRGDHLHVLGHTTDTDLVVDSIEINHQQVPEAAEGQNIGVRVDERVREHDEVYKAYL